jgi:hypothetical protein
MLAGFTTKSWAMTPLQEHMLLVTQGMANFYMYQLSQGNEKYFKQFENYQSKASYALRKLVKLKDKNQQAKDLSKKWNILNEKLNMTGVDTKLTGEVPIMAGVVRRESREYLTHLYLQVFNQKTLAFQGPENDMAQAQLLIAMLATRALDLVSDNYGPTGLTDHDLQFNPVQVEKTVSQNIKGLLMASVTEEQSYDFKKLQSKFNFIKSPLIDYHLQTPYFLIFENLKSMNKLFRKNQLIQVAKQ